VIYIFVRFSITKRIAASVDVDTQFLTPLLWSGCLDCSKHISLHGKVLHRSYMSHNGTGLMYKMHVM